MYFLVLSTWRHSVKPLTTWTAVLGLTVKPPLWSLTGPPSQAYGNGTVRGGLGSLTACGPGANAMSLV